MARTEIVAVTEGGSTDKAAAAMFGRLESAGFEVERVTNSGPDETSLATELRAALQRAPDALMVIGTETRLLGAAFAQATDRVLSAGLPEGATATQSYPGLALIVARTLALSVPADPAALASAWDAEVAATLAEWAGHLPHVRGELVVLQAPASAVERLLALQADLHPAVYLKAEALGQGMGVRVSALASLGGDDPEDAVNQALAAVERAAVGNRLLVSSTGRVPAVRG